MNASTGTMADLARHLGVARSSVTRAVQAGRIQPGADGRYDFAACAAAWHAAAGGRGDVAARHAKNRGAGIPNGQTGQKNAPDADFGEMAAMGGGPLGSDPAKDSGRAKAKTLLMHYENSAIKLEMALRRGLRIDLATAKREAAGLGSLLRAGIERIIDQTAPRLAAAGNELERRIIVEREIRRLRRMLKRELPRSLRRMKEQGARGGKVGAGATARGDE